MSNILNNVEIRTTVTGLARSLKLKENEERPSVSFMVSGKMSRLPDDPLRPNGNLNVLALHEALKKAHVKVALPRRVNKNISVRTEGLGIFSEEFERFAETVGYPEELILPLGTEQVKMRYIPPMMGSDPDNYLLVGLAAVAASNGSNSAEAIEVYQKLRRIAETHTYSTGTYQGLVSRLAETTAVRNGKEFLKSGQTVKFNRPKSLKDLDLSTEDMLEILNRFMPVHEAPDNYKYLKDVESLFDIQQLMDYENQVPREYDPDRGDRFIEYSKNTNAGMPYQSKKKWMVQWEAMALSQQFIRSVRKLLNAKKSDKEISEAFIQNWFWMAVGLIFPKAEPYSDEKYLTSTRYIWSAPFPLFMLVSMITQPLTKLGKYNITNLPGTPSLLGFSPYHGGMHTFLKLALEAKKPTAFVYSDNIYIVYPPTAKKGRRFYSLDLIKGEANAEQTRASVLMHYLLSAGWTSDTEMRFTAEWAYFATKMVPQLIIDSWGLLGTTLLKIPGQGSGNPITAQVNQTTSAIFVYFWEKRGCPPPGSSGWADLCEEVGINIQVEYEDPDLDATCAQARADPAVPPVNPGFVVKLDLLGFDAVFNANSQTYQPILNETRLEKSLVLDKADESRIVQMATDLIDSSEPDPETRDAQIGIARDLITESNRAMRYESMYILGAWRSKAVSQALIEVISSARRRRKALLASMGDSSYEKVIKKLGMRTGVVAVLFSSDNKLPEDEMHFIDSDTSDPAEIQNFLNDMIERLGRQVEASTLPRPNPAKKLGGDKMVDQSMAERATALLFSMSSTKASELKERVLQLQKDPDVLQAVAKRARIWGLDTDEKLELTYVEQEKTRELNKMQADLSQEINAHVVKSTMAFRDTDFPELSRLMVQKRKKGDTQQVIVEGQNRLPTKTIGESKKEAEEQDQVRVSMVKKEKGVTTDEAEKQVRKERLLSILKKKQIAREK